MLRSSHRIITSHAGSLPRPPELMDLNRAKNTGAAYDESERAQRIRDSVPDVVRKQVDAGVDVVGDGEYGKTSFLNYVQDRLGGFESTGRHQQMGAMADKRRDRTLFSGFYEAEFGGRYAGGRREQVCTGPIVYTGQALLQADIDNFKAALKGTDVAEAFIPALSPTYNGDNQYYKTTEEYEVAVAEAMAVEYKAITDAGFVLQIDDPGLPAQWDGYVPAIGLEEYLKVAARRIELLNHALRDVPEDRIRYHTCWGSWHAPHVTDIPLADIVDLMLAVKAECYSIEAANVRHEHEWKVWRDVKLPDGKSLMPGVISHATNVVEHPELVADRLITYANLVGRENVIAGTDCGMSRVHDEVCWAKLAVMAEGAALASKQLW